MLMTKTEREIQRKLRVLTHAAQISDVSKACRYFGVARASFYRWKSVYQRYGEAGLANRKTAPKNPANRTAPEIVDKVLHLRQAYHLGPIRIVWYLARYHGIKISDAGVYRILKRHRINRLPRGTRLRKIHTTRYEQKVPGHQIQVDVKFLTFQGKDGNTIKRYQHLPLSCCPNNAEPTQENTGDQQHPKLEVNAQQGNISSRTARYVAVDIRRLSYRHSTDAETSVDQHLRQLQADALVQDAMRRFDTHDLVAFNGDLLRELATQFLALAEKQEARDPVIVGHRLMGPSR
jgi:transposase